MIEWQKIDTVLLDMDGTLLDLHFDNYFWLRHLPSRYAEHFGLYPDEATRELHERIAKRQGTLEWYCLDHWTNQLGIDIVQLKEEVNHLIRERPFAREFLTELQRHGKKRVLITNAHRRSLDIKLRITGIDTALDTIISSHDYRAPKESPEFWHSLENALQLDPARCLFIDDSEPVLSAARSFGIGQVLGLALPDSQREAKTFNGFSAIHHFSELLPISDSRLSEAVTAADGTPLPAAALVQP